MDRKEEILAAWKQVDKALVECSRRREDKPMKGDVPFWWNWDSTDWCIVGGGVITVLVMLVFLAFISYLVFWAK